MFRVIKSLQKSIKIFEINEKILFDTMTVQYNCYGKLTTGTVTNSFASSGLCIRGSSFQHKCFILFYFSRGIENRLRTLGIEFLGVFITDTVTPFYAVTRKNNFVVNVEMKKQRPRSFIKCACSHGGTSPENGFSLINSFSPTVSDLVYFIHYKKIIFSKLNRSNMTCKNIKRL